MLKIQLKNGEVVYGRVSQTNYHRMLIKIMEDVAAKLGYIPSIEEAASCPWMPENLELYNKHCISYHMAMKEVAKRQKNRQLWRKATPEEVAEIERRIKAKEYVYQSTIPVRPIVKAPEVVIEPEPIAEPEAKAEPEAIVEPEAPSIKEEETNMQEKEPAVVTIEEVLHDFAVENLRWPTDIEISEYARQGIPGWKSHQIVRKMLGYRETWGEQIFPEGLPEGFKNSRTGNRTKRKNLVPEEIVPEVEDVEEVAPDVDAPSVDTPKEIYVSSVKRLLDIMDSVGGIDVDFRLLIRLPGEEAPTEMHFALKTI